MLNPGALRARIFYGSVWFKSLPHLTEANLKVRDVLKLLKKDGWYDIATVGSHRQMKHPIKLTTLRLPKTP
jgi:HicA toxin of bacterial toxin-antitoxin,